MNIDEMSDQEKSDGLVKLTGLQVYPIEPEHNDCREGWLILCDSPYLWFSYETEDEFDLYEAPMELSWHVLNWAAETWADGNWINWAMYEPYFLLDKSAEVAQRAWLDKILELLIEAGMVEDDKIYT